MKKLKIFLKNNIFHIMCLVVTLVCVATDDLPEYTSEKATFEELKQQNSYFIDDLINKK